MRKYSPRRASQRWLAGAPEFILDCFDDQRTCDRYTVIFGKDFMSAAPGGGNVLQYLGMSGAPTHPQGFSQWGELSAADAAAYRYRNGRYRVRWQDLPEHIRLHVLVRALSDDTPVRHRKTGRTGMVESVKSDCKRVTVKWDDGAAVEAAVVSIAEVAINYEQKESV